MFGRIGLRETIVIFFTTLAALTSAGVVGAAYYSANDELTLQSYEHLGAVAELKAAQLGAYFQTIDDHLVTLAADPSVVSAMGAFTPAVASLASGSTPDLAPLKAHYASEFLPHFEELGTAAPAMNAYWPTDPIAQRMQDQWIRRNPLPTGRKAMLDSSGTGDTYDIAHERFHPSLRLVQSQFGYYDLFLIAPDGRVVYSVSKEVDFGTSLTTGPWRNSGLAAVFRAAVAEVGHREMIFEDFAPYGASYGAAASFIAAPIRRRGKLIGVVAVQTPIRRISDLMTNGRRWADVGLGASGETFAIGPDHRFRSESRFLLTDRDAFIAQLRSHGVSGKAVAQIERQKTAVGILQLDDTVRQMTAASGRGRGATVSARGREVLATWRTVAIGGTSWRVVTEIDRSEALAPAARLRNLLLLLVLLAIGIIMLAAVWMSRTIVRPVQELASKAAALSRGELDQPVETSREDEIGDLSREFEHMRVSIRELVRRQEAAIEALRIPIIPLGDRALVLPLVGVLDAGRLAQLRTDLLRSLHDSQADFAIIDITGVPTLEAADAHLLAQLAKGADLIGARVILTGMRPQVAATLADLDTPFRDLVTLRTLEQGISLMNTAP
ncbi:MAG: HAMP domain-containing protein [Myxococcales bacterium]|nr:HAMP domain-containing protein [Myxococcales bacterium]